MPGVESFEIQDDKHWTAKVKVPLGLGGLQDDDELREARGARAGVRVDAREGPRRRRAHGHEDVVHLSEAGAGTSMAWEADVKIAGPVGAMGQRVLQPIVNQQVAQVLDALEKRVADPASAPRDKSLAPWRSRFASASCS